MTRNIVEGYGRKSHQADFIKFLTCSHARCLETSNHIEKIKSLYPELSEGYKGLYEQYDVLGAELHAFIQYVENSWRT